MSGSSRTRDGRGAGLVVLDVVGGLVTVRHDRRGVSRGDRRAVGLVPAQALLVAGAVR